MKGIRFLIFTSICCLGLYFQVLAGGEKLKDTFTLEAHYATGKVVPVYPNFPPNIFSNTVELHLGYEVAGNKVWHRLFNYPRLGMSLIFQELGNPKILGEQISIVPTVYFSTAKNEDAKLLAEIRYGLGLAIFTRPYDTIRNPRNQGAGSYCTWQYTIGANMKWNVSRKVSLQLGGIWYHASNAHTVLPNVGVNNFAVYIGALVYPFGKKERIHSLDSVAPEKKWHINFRFGSGFQEKGSAFGPVNGKKYPVYTASVYASKRLWKVFLVKVGATYRYYPMYEEFIREHKVFDSHFTLRSSAFIVFLGNEFQLGHFAINMEAGVNLYKPAYKTFYNFYEESSAYSYYTKQYICTRFGLSYYLFDPYLHPRNNIFIGACVSANLGQAEFLELNVGYVF